MDSAHLIAVMRQAALDAGAAILAVRARGDMTAREKADRSPVTEADEAADAIIAHALRGAFPDLPLVTEEQVDSHSVAAARFLIVDPLDGTREFLAGNRDFTVNIALVEEGRPVHGVVCAPAHGRLFRTTPEGRAVEETADGQTRAIGVNATPDNRALRLVVSRSHRDPATDAYVSHYAMQDAVSAGSSLKFGLVATDEADLYPRLGRTMEWDTAAGDAVLRAAGGEVVRFDDHTPLTYGKPGYENPAFLAYAPGVLLVRG